MDDSKSTNKIIEFFSLMIPKKPEQNTSIVVEDRNIIIIYAMKIFQYLFGISVLSTTIIRIVEIIL